MSSHPFRHGCAVLTLAAVIAGCDSSGSDPAAQPISLSGPLSTALATADGVALSADGSVDIAAMLSGFPAAASTDFAARFLDSVPDEQTRTVSYNAGVVVGEVYGIEGENAAETEEVLARYGADGTFLSSIREVELATVPTAVSNTLSSLYPGATVDEAHQRQDENGVTTYAVELENAQAELDLVLDAAGALITTTEEITSAQLPAAVAAAVQQELTSAAEIEYEQTTNAQNGTTVYTAEMENDTESVELEYTASGEILSMTFEQDR